MDDKKSIPSNNQVENHGKDIQSDNNILENGDCSNIMQYGRDILLNLRLHPLSLQKPLNLPDIEVVKDKLQLHDVVDSTVSADKNMDERSYQSSLKSDYCNLKHDYPYYHHYFNRLNPYSYPYMYNRSYQNASKYRSPYHTYCSAFKKSCVAKDSCYKNISDESLWAKQCYLTSDDVWNCYPSHVHSNHIKSKEDVDAIPKCRKKLSIIDPVTGKNILDGVISTPSENERDTCAAQTNSKCSENDITSGEKYTGDYFCCTEMIDQFKEVPKDIPSSHIDDGEFSENEKDILTDQAAYIDKKIKDVCKFEGRSDKTSLNFDKDADGDVDALCDSETTLENVQSELKSCQSKKSTPEADKLLNKPLPKFYQAKEPRNSNIHCNCLIHGRIGSPSQISKENVLKESDFVRDNLKQLKEKINTLTQEHQKMAIMQSFLRYKKFKLEETARNLDEKRIEIANCECNLLKKAKELLEKEQWLNSKEEKLQCKEQQLSEWEKMLNKDITKEASHNFLDYRNDGKEQLSEKKFELDSCLEAPWDEVPISNKYRVEDNEEFAYFSSKPNKVSNNVSSVEKCITDTSSLDELEKNIVLMEKVSSPSETNNKPELSSFNVSKKKDDIPSCDPLGYSKGRRYLPEHMKYWLNKRDRSAI